MKKVIECAPRSMESHKYRISLKTGKPRDDEPKRDDSAIIEKKTNVTYEGGYKM